MLVTASKTGVTDVGSRLMVRSVRIVRSSPIEGNQHPLRRKAHVKNI